MSIVVLNTYNDKMIWVIESGVYIGTTELRNRKTQAFWANWCVVNMHAMYYTCDYTG